MRNRTVATVIRVIALALAAIALKWTTVDALRCAEMLRRVETQIPMLEKLSADRAARPATNTLNRLEALAPCCQPDADLHIALASLDNIVGRRDRALQHLDDALRVEDRPEIYFDKGLTLLDLGRINAAVAQFAVACEFNMRLLELLEGDLRVRVGEEAIRLQKLHGTLRATP